MIQMYLQTMPRQGPRHEHLLQRLFMTILLGILCAGTFLISGSATAQTRDHLTDQETELVRFHQELDKRIDVFIRAIDRRFAIINGTAPPAAKKLVKDEPEWGEIPKGTRAELLGDIAGILDEAITNLDDVRALCAVQQEGITGAITGRAIYEGTLDFAAAQKLADQLSENLLVKS